ncbi:WD40 repeat domain-containing protein [Mangrovimonas sp. ST2L15]|uniref:WD40 repeat domain-containing protein n=1 Tax=Mangrovimonas sp. ST2L15 TaxID=1645916 RepID=UPI0006B63DDE|nr:WD40 repeat domain-containing protein [Mangrovimonas sp. ST2L15]
MNKIQTFFLTIILFGCKASEKQESFTDKGLLWTVNWSSDGRYIATGGNQDTLRLFLGKNFKREKNYPLTNTITKLKWHPKDKKLAVSTQISTDKAKIIDLENNAIIVLDSISKDGARGIGWNFDGKLLAVGDNEGMLTIFDKKGNIIKKIDVKQKSITGLSWHPKKNTIVTVGSQIGIYDYENDNLFNIKPRNQEVLMLCIDWHPSGEFFVTGDYGDFEKNYPPLLQFWSANGDNIKNIEKSKLEYRNIKWSKNGEVLATAGDYVRLWDKTGDLIREEKAKNTLWGIDWSPKDNRIVTTDKKGRITIWDINLNIIKELNY